MCASRCKYTDNDWTNTRQNESEEILLWGIYLCSQATHHLSATPSFWQHSSLSYFFCELLVVEIPDLRSFFSELFCEPILLSAQHVYTAYTPRAVVQCVEPHMVGIPQGLSPHPQQSLEQPCCTIVNKMQPTNPNAHTYVNGYRCRNTWKCSHAEHFSETVYLNSLVHISPVTIPAHCRLWNMEEGGVLSVEYRV